MPISGNARETAGPVFMYASMAGIFQQMDLAAFQFYRDRLMADSGNPTDPIEVMMIEQIALAHMNIGRQQFQLGDGPVARGGLRSSLRWDGDDAAGRISQDGFGPEGLSGAGYQGRHG